MFCYSAMKKILLWLLLFFGINSFGVAQKAQEYFKAAIISTEKKMYKQAIAYCDLAINSNSTYAQAYYHRGYNKFMLKDYQGALVDFNVSIDLNNENLNAYLYRGLCNQCLGNNISATRDYNYARRIDAVETLAFITGNIFRTGFRSN